jgi:hypothetical protein
MTDRPNKMVNGEITPLTDSEWADYQDRLVPTPPSTDPNDYELTAIQFEKALVRLDIDRFTIPDALKSLYTNGTITKEVYADYLSRWLQLTSIKRDSDVITILKPTYNVTNEQIDAAWLKAAGVTGD